MAVFESKAKMQTVLGGLFENLLADPEFGPKYVKSGITIKFNISDPNAELWITPGDGTTGEVIWGGNGHKATRNKKNNRSACADGAAQQPKHRVG